MAKRDTSTAVLEQPTRRTSTSPPGACIGLPVQYHMPTGAVPGVLQRQSITDPNLWDVKVMISGAATLVLRAAVAYSADSKPGCWSLLPGWSYHPDGLE